MPQTVRKRPRFTFDRTIRPVFPVLRPVVISLTEIRRSETGVTVPITLNTVNETGWHNIDISKEELYSAGDGARLRWLIVHATIANSTASVTVTVRLRLAAVGQAFATTLPQFGISDSTITSASEFVFTMKNPPLADMRIYFSGQKAAGADQSMTLSDIIVEGEFVE